MFEIPRRGRQARNFGTKGSENSRSEIQPRPQGFSLNFFREKHWGRGCLKSSSEQVFSENWRCIDFEGVNGVLKILHIRSKTSFDSFEAKYNK